MASQQSPSASTNSLQSDAAPTSAASSTATLIPKVRKIAINPQIAMLIFSLQKNTQTPTSSSLSHAHPAQSKDWEAALGTLATSYGFSGDSPLKATSKKAKVKAPKASAKSKPSESSKNKLVTFAEPMVPSKLLPAAVGVIGAQSDNLTQAKSCKPICHTCATIRLHPRKLVLALPKILAAFAYHPRTSATTYSWAHSTMKARYCQATRDLVDTDNGWHFSALHASATQVLDFRIEDMASKMQSMAPELCDLIVALLVGGESRGLKWSTSDEDEEGALIDADEIEYRSQLGDDPPVWSSEVSGEGSRDIVYSNAVLESEM
ncbi:hypothetical protein IEO21_05706 [Rhodonia placenta]|uniref:Uncharacterized protein n=1 Tax=Rhodonia placenta TaxID=104341 RepID=A0A8H7P1B2_9APHY|nr:hypothetical protein IEO21_05706 [Postia placenta]